MKNKVYEQDLMKIGQKLRVTRQRRQEKLAVVASALNLSTTTISLIENGKYYGVHYTTLREFCSYFSLPISELVQE